MCPVDMSMLEWAGSSLQEEVLVRADGLGIGPSLNWDETLFIREAWIGSDFSTGGFTAIRCLHSSYSENVTYNILVFKIATPTFSTLMHPMAHTDSLVPGKLQWHQLRGPRWGWWASLWVCDENGGADSRSRWMPTTLQRYPRWKWLSESETWVILSDCTLWESHSVYSSRGKNEMLFWVTIENDRDLFNRELCIIK